MICQQTSTPFFAAGDVAQPSRSAGFIWTRTASMPSDALALRVQELVS